MLTISKLKTVAVKILQTALLSLCLFCAAGSRAEVDSLSLPSIGDSTASIFSPEFERRLGQAFLSQIRRQANIITDPEIETYIRSIGYRLVSHSDNNTQQFTFFIINEPTINAFAAPGGIVGVNSGTILSAASESELAGVLAHEISHVTQRHMARSFEMQSRMSIPMMAAMLGAIILATQNAEAGQAALIAAQGAAAQMQINFTRSHEEEADRIGMQLLARAEFNPRGMPGFFEKLLQDSRYQGQAPEFLRTHPLTTNRIADTRARAESFPREINYHESANFNYIKSKLMVLLRKNPYDAVKYFQQRLENEPYSDEFASLSYGHALALMQMDDYDQAEEKLMRLRAADPENSALILALADLEIKRNNYDRAFEIYADTMRLYPDYRPIVFAYARALLEDHRPDQAKEILREYGKYYEPDIIYYEYLARAEGEAGNKIESGMANAEYYYLAGETTVAIDQIRSLLTSSNPKPDFYQRERLQDRLVFMERELKIERDMKIRE
jgi:predicted Zn-dependent protease